MTNLQDPKEEKAENVISYFERNKSSVNNNEIEERIKKLAKNSSKWQLKKYDLCNALPLHTFDIKIFCLLFFVAISILSPLPKTLSIHTFGGLINIILAIAFLWIICKEYYCCCTNKFTKLKLRYSCGVHFLLPRLLGAIIGAWLMIFFASNILPQFYAIRFNNCELLLKNGVIVFIILSLTFLFVYDEINRKVPYLDKKKIVPRTISLLSIAFFYSYITGIFATALIGTKAVTSKEYEYSIHIDFYGSDVYISPGFLFIFTFVAMFIGLFINRIFEDKQIVDSE
jgi:hypothetical protein